MNPATELHQQFRDRVARISRHVFRHALEALGGCVNLEGTPGRERFIALVHEGFGLAQEEIIDGLLAIGSRKTALKQRLGGLSGALAKSAREELALLDFEERAMRRLADTIAWQLIELEHHVARRAWTGESPPALATSNLAHCREFAAEYNRSHPLGFALLADITSFVQIGDVLIRDATGATPKVSFVELKQGPMNEVVSTFADFYLLTRCSRALEFFEEEHGPHAIAQLQRILRQEEKGRRLETVLNRGSGVDPTGTYVRISQDTFELDSFVDRVTCLLQECDRRGWAIDCVDDCLAVGAYQAGFPARDLFGLWMRGVGCTYPIVDLRDSLHCSLTPSPFLIGLGHMTAVQLLLGDKLLLLCLDLGKWLELGKSLHLHGRWLSTKKTSRLVHRASRLARPYVYRNRAIEFSAGGNSITLGDGILMRILYEFTSPSSALQLLKHMTVHAYTGPDAQFSC